MVMAHNGNLSFSLLSLSQREYPCIIAVSFSSSQIFSRKNSTIRGNNDVINKKQPFHTQNIYDIYLVVIRTISCVCFQLEISQLESLMFFHCAWPEIVYVLPLFDGRLFCLFLCFAGKEKMLLLHFNTFIFQNFLVL